MSGTRTARAPCIGLFVEGAHAVDQRGHDALRLLWGELSRRAVPHGAKLFVHGFSKAQIVSLHEPPGARHDREPLDILIERHHRSARFDIVVVAFDAEPPNQHLKRSCLHSEVDFVLTRFAVRKYLPQPFLDEASHLKEIYAKGPKTPRPAGRPPRGPLDMLFMDPMFEALLVADESAALRALGFAKRPKDWPKFDAKSRKPDAHIFEPITKLTAKAAVRRVRGDFRANKHAWALEIIRAADPHSPLWQHPIALRLAVLLS